MAISSLRYKAIQIITANVLSDYASYSENTTKIMCLLEYLLR